MNKKRLLGILMSAGLVFGTAAPAVNAQTNDDFLKPIQLEQWKGKTIVEKPLVVLMDFKDYKYDQFDEKEDWSRNYFKGEECTPEFYEKKLFGDKTYKRPDGKEFVTMKNFYETVSGGSYSVEGKVAGWYTAKNNAADYGSNDPWDQTNAFKLAEEAVHYLSEDPNVDLSEFDVLDKDDADKDGNYYEPDGIIDSLIVVHAGIGEDWGGGSLGADAIWPFRRGFSWYAEDEGGNLKPYEVKDNSNKKYKFDDFIMVDQDLEVATLCHEYGHYLGLPDLYAGGWPYSKPPVETWSTMASNHAGEIPGSKPNCFGAFCNEMLQRIHDKTNIDTNWQKGLTVNLEDVNEKGIDVLLDQASLKGVNEDAVRIDLPDYPLFTAPSGEQVYFSGKGDNLRNHMTTSIDLTDKKNAELTFKTWYKIDPYFDFLTIRVREEGSEEWKTIKGNLTTTEVDNYIKENYPEQVKERNPGYGITDTSNGKFVDGIFDLTEYAGKKIDLRFNFWTDGNTPEEGFYVDDIKVMAEKEEIFSDNADGESKFKLEGFNQTKSPYFGHYYLIEWRNSENSEIDKLEPSWNKFSYDPGLVAWYIDKQYVYGRKNDPDQHTLNHIGHCGVGIVDAGQEPVKALYISKDGKATEDKISRYRHQLYDSAFSLRTKQSVLEQEIDENGAGHIYYNSDTAVKSVFDDSRDYSNSRTDEQIGLTLPNYGLKVLVTDENAEGSTARIHIMRANGEEKTKANKEYENAKYIKSIVVENNEVTVETKGELSDKAKICYVLDTPQGIVEKTIDLDLKEGKFIGAIDFGKELNKCTARVSSIIISDKEGSKKAVYNSETHNGYGMDLSEGNIN